jgi:hypothetical protein
MDPSTIENLSILRLFKIIAWISLPTVMYGGYVLLGFLSRGRLSPFQLTNFRAGHAHAGVLLLMSLLYIQSMEQTTLHPTIKILTGIVLVVGVVLQSGGFFFHLLKGQPGTPSWGTRMTKLGALNLGTAVLVLVYGLFVTYF